MKTWIDESASATGQRYAFKEGSHLGTSAETMAMAERDLVALMAKHRAHLDDGTRAILDQAVERVRWQMAGERSTKYLPASTGLKPTGRRALFEPELRAAVVFANHDDRGINGHLRNHRSR